jgi:ParB-like chromosome segregation protein Spo0J
MTYEFHPVAGIFPMMSERELQDLADDIRAHGLREPIWIHEQRIIDGRNRYLACQRAGVEPQYRVWDGEGSVVAFVVSLNLHRRHLDDGQRALVAGRIATLKRGDNQHAPIGGTSQAEAAELLNASVRSVQRAVDVLEQGTPELVEAVERGDLSVSFAAKVTELPPQDQQEIAKLPKTEALEEYKKRAHVANNSGNNEWYTPAPFVSAAREAMGGIDCDPASSDTANATVNADRFFTAEQDGLKQQTWGERVWMNPPYAQPLIGQFAADLVRRHSDGQVAEACVLVNNATETAWFQTMLEVASAVCLIKGRVRFMDPDGKPSGAPLQGQVVLYLGRNADKFAQAFSEFGRVLYALERAA